MSEYSRLAVFDCDGTLVDSQHSIINCMQAGFDEVGMSRPNSEEIRRVVGLPLDKAIKILNSKVTLPTINRIRDGYRTAWTKLRKYSQLHEPLYPNVVETLDELTISGWKLGIATGKSYHGLIHTLDCHQVTDYFSTLQTADRAHGKPHPEMLIKAMEEVATNTDNTVMIGDTTFDMEMAKNAGVPAIGVTWGYHSGEELALSGALKLIHDYSELTVVLNLMKST